MKQPSLRNTDTLVCKDIAFESRKDIVAYRGKYGVGAYCASSEFTFGPLRLVAKIYGNKDKRGGISFNPSMPQGARLTAEQKESIKADIVSAWFAWPMAVRVQDLTVEALKHPRSDDEADDKPKDNKRPTSVAWSPAMAASAPKLVKAVKAKAVKATEPIVEAAALEA